MQKGARFALAFCFLVAALLPVCFADGISRRQAANSAASPNPKQLYESLEQLHVDEAHVYTVHDLTLRRYGIAFTLSDGKLAFLQPIDQHLTGAVFIGRGHIFAVPPDSAERASIARFIRTPLLDTEISQAYLRFDDATAQEIEASLTNQKAVAAPDSDFANNWNAIVTKYNSASTLRVLESLLSSEPLPYFYGAFSSPVLGGFDVLLDERRAETVLIGQPQQANGADFFDVWASYPPENAPVHLLDFTALDYATDTSIGDDLSLNGSTTLHLKCISGGQRMLELELSRFLQVQTVADGDGHTLDFFQNQDMRRREIARRGNDVVFVTLPEPTVAGQQYELHVSYHGTVIEDDGNGVYFVGARGSWYPHLSGTDQFASFDLRFHWPKRLRLVATGKEVESSEDNGQHTGEWRSTEPIALVGFNLGEYDSQSVGQNPLIELFANPQLEQSIADRLRERATNPFSANAQPLPILPRPSAVLKELGAKLLDSVHYYEGLNGAFPFPQLDVSQIPGSFGQGWPGLLYLSTFAFLPPEAQSQAGLNQRAQEQVQQLFPFHEVVHQWWGNILVPASYRDVWIEEGMADYQSLMYEQKKNLSKQTLQAWLMRYRDALIAKEPGTGETVDESGPLDFGYRLDTSKTPDAYTTIVYQKGAWVLHMIRMMLRDPRRKNPDARFEQLLKNTLTDHHFQTLSTAQFEHEVERLMTPSMDLESSRSMDWFFDEWVRQTGVPEYSVSFSVHPRETRFLVEGSLAQRNVANIFTERVPIYGELAQGKPFFLGDVVTTGAATSFKFTSRVRPIKLVIDPEHTILCRTK